MAIPIDSHYIPAFSIETVILDKDTGAPLSGGLVYFEQDNNLGVLKPVFQITGTSPNYTFTQLPNPMTLSAIGTFEDSLSNPVVPYFYPYNASLGVELYYVRVTSADDVPQFTRQAVPFIAGSGVTPGESSSILNELSNPQFAEVFFDSPTTLNFNAAVSEVVSIAPDWDLVVSSSGVATVTLSIVTPTGALNDLTNPGTILRINSGGVTTLLLRQRLTGSPNLWGSGYLSGTFVARTGAGTSKVLTLSYSQSDGVIVDQVISTGTLDGSGTYAAHPGSVFIDASTSADSFPDAYIDIFFNVPVSSEIDITSVMVAFTDTVSVPDIVYDQESNARQIDHLFHYYKPGLDFKPIPSMLVGWDFATNPAQIFGDNVSPKAVGANKSYYAWDQTIIFQTVNNSITIDRSVTDLSMNVVATTAGQFALIQYLTGKQATKIFLNMADDGVRVSANAEVASTPVAPMTISLWWSANPSLPDMNSNNSLVTGLDANGYPTVVGGWTEITRDKAYSGQFANSVASKLESFGFPNYNDVAPYLNPATLFAIVIGTAPLTINSVVQFQSISLVPGSVPTIPAPQTPDEVLRECQYYYEISYESGDLIGTASLPSEYSYAMPTVDVVTGANSTNTYYADTFNIRYNTVKVSRTPIITLYSPVAPVSAGTVFGQMQVTGVPVGTKTSVLTAATYWTQAGLGSKAATYVATALSAIYTTTQAGAGAQKSNGLIIFQATIDARLGIV
jgi:hypothetical protein